MEMLEIIGTDLELNLLDYLSAWESVGGEAAALHMAWLVQEYDSHAPYGEHWFALSEAWIEGPAPSRILEKALLSPSSREIEQELGRALALHRWWGRRPTGDRELDEWWSQKPT